MRNTERRNGQRDTSEVSNISYTLISNFCGNIHFCDVSYSVCYIFMAALANSYNLQVIWGYCCRPKKQRNIWMLKANKRQKLDVSRISVGGVNVPSL